MERLIWAQGAPSTLRAVTTTIRGVRINMAAAICWENYMPLVRQSLYAQNVNLYLAPTADGRDSWLALMRTVGIEGRCFVVSSNMAVRGGAEDHGAPLRRSEEVVTEEGHEVALPKSLALSKSPTRRRRKSVIVEDGNEIVLCCDEGEMNGQTEAQTKTAGASWTCRGGSSVVSPFGDVLAGPQWEDDAGLIYTDVDFKECVRGRLDLDTGGSYSRNDSFNLTVQGLNLDPLPY